VGIDVMLIILRISFFRYSEHPLHPYNVAYKHLYIILTHLYYMRKGFLWMFIAITLLTSAFAINIDSSATGAGNDYYRSGFALDEGTSAGFTEDPQSIIELKDGFGAVPTFDLFSDPLICDVDSSITGRELIYTYNNLIHIYNSAGQLLKTAPWSTQLNAPTCADVDNDGLDEVHGVVNILGVPVYQVYGDSGGGSLGVLSQNSLSGFGSTPYSEVICIDGVETVTGGGYCAFTTDTQVRVYEWDSGAGNMATVASSVIESGDRFSTPVWIDTADAFDILPSTNEFYLTFARHTQYYRWSLDLFTSGMSDLQNVSLEKEIYDAAPLTGNFRSGFENVDMRSRNNQSAILSNGSTVNDAWLTTVQLYPTFILGTTTAVPVDCISPITTESQFRFALFDDDEDGFNDIAFFCAQTNGGFDVTKYTRVMFYNPSLQFFAGTRRMAEVSTGGPSGQPVYSYDGTSYDYPIVTDINNDGDLDLLQSSRMFGQPGAGGGLITPNTYLTAGATSEVTGWLNVSVPGEARMAVGDIDEDARYDLVVGKWLFLHVGGVSPEFEPVFSFIETAPTAGRCDSESGSTCTVIVDDNVTYSISLSDDDSSTLYVSYDCDSRYLPNPIPLQAVTTATYNFSCTYDAQGLNVNTTVYVSDTPVYGTNKKVSVDVTNIGGSLCNYNGIFEPLLGETELNCFPDFQTGTTFEDANETFTEETLSAEREAFLTSVGVSPDQSLYSITVVDGEIVRSGSLEDTKLLIWKLFSYLVALLPYLLLLVILIGIIAFAGGKK